MKDSTYLVSFECKHCGWDWMGSFAYCPYCHRSDVKVIDYESVEDFVERMVLMREREMEEPLFILEEWDWDK